MIIIKRKRDTGSSQRACISFLLKRSKEAVEDA
jgi:hypothetical protein